MGAAAGFNRVALIVLVAGATAAWMAYQRYFVSLAPSSQFTIVAPEVPVVMRTLGGLLEVSTVTAYERFSRADSREFWGVDLGTTASQIQVTVVDRYHIEMAKEWPMAIEGTRCIVRAGDLRPIVAGCI